MTAQTWVNYVSAAPIAADFASTKGYGAALVISQKFGMSYYLNSSNTPMPLNRYEFGDIGSGFCEKRLFAPVNGSNYGFSEVTLCLYNPNAAPFDNEFLFTYGAEGTLNNDDTVPAYDFYLYDAQAAKYRMVVDGPTGEIKLGGTDALSAYTLTIPTTGGLKFREIAAASIATPAATFQTLFIDSADHKLKRKDSSGTVTVIA